MLHISKRVAARDGDNISAFYRSAAATELFVDVMSVSHRLDGRGENLPLGPLYATEDEGSASHAVCRSVGYECCDLLVV